MPSPLPPNDDAIPALVLVFIIVTLRFVVGCVHAQEDISVSNQQSKDRTTTKRNAAPSGPAPTYLVTSADDEELIGGNSTNLGPPRGPTRTSLTFRVYTPPSFDKEIPKVDLYGAITFVRTGKVRTFVQTGARRLLVVNFQQMTLAVYAPREHKQRHKVKTDEGIFATPQKRTNQAEHNAEVKPKLHDRRASGICISASTRNVFSAFHEEEEAEEDSEESWKPRHFQAKPELVLSLNDLTSIAAVPPRHGGVLEIMSQCRASPADHSHGDKKEVSQQSHTQKKKSGKSKGNGKSPAQKKKQMPQQHSVIKGGEVSNVGGETQSEYDIKTITNESSHVGEVSMQERRDEFAFRTPRDAAEFQRITMALRAVGREVSYLYETLELVPKKKIDGAEDEKANKYASPGVALDDAWQCFQEHPILRKGLVQYRTSIQSKQRAYGFSGTGILEEGLDFYHKKPSNDVLGLVDFFAIFVPPLSEDKSEAFAGYTPCAKPEPMSREGGPSSMLTRGIEWHYQQLSYVSSLQRLVRRAALHVRVYAWAKRCVGSGWVLHEADTNTHEIASDSVVESDTHFGSSADSSIQSSSIASIRHQGYSLVGWHAFKRPTSNNDEAVFGVSNNGDAWLSPESDPYECIPSLRGLIRRYPYSHFFIFTHFDQENSIAIYFLFVRLLPVGVDRGFDSVVNNLICRRNEDLRKRVGVSLHLQPGDGSSLFTRVVFGVYLSVLRREMIKAAMELRSKTEQTKPMVLLYESLASNLASLWNFGGDQVNYFAVNSQLDLSKFPNRVGRWLLGKVATDLHTPNVVQFGFMLKTFSCEWCPERVISSIKMKNVDIATALIEYNVAPALQDQSSDDSSINAKNDRCPDEMYGTYIDTIREILDDMTVPVRKKDQARGEHNHNNQGTVITIESVNKDLTRSDIERYLIACGCDIKGTVVRLVESVAWRKSMFPVDQRSCRIELESGQFFQQGYDKESHPIFYFRESLVGHWRADINATLMAILHRLETFVENTINTKKFTLVALFGSPEHRCSKTKKEKGGRTEEEDNQSESLCRDHTHSTIGSDPRVDPYERYQSHANLALLSLLSEILPRHYPERLAKALLVTGKGWKKKILRSYVPPQIARSKIHVLGSLDNLKKFVNEDELVEFAGGKATTTPNAFQASDFFL